MMTLESLKKLTDELDVASEFYYKNNGVGCTMSDAEFDLKFKELQEGEKYWNVVYPNSPTLRVGSDIQKEFGKIKHPIPMLTIENTYDDNGLIDWISKMKDKYGVTTYNISVKYDGISCELHYRNGYLLEASTRGDKNIGDDITNNVRTIKSVPLSIGVDYDFYVRGEILMPKSVLEKLNKDLESKGEKTFSNTRNACSGSVKQLDSKVTAKRGLIFRAWDCYWDNCDSYPVDTMTEKTDVLNRLGFEYDREDVENYNVNTLPFRSDNVIEDVNNFKEMLKSAEFDFDYDGIVIKVDDLNIQKKIGTKDTRAIEWGIARKWNEEYEVWTELCGVEWSVGPSGNVTPVGLLDPVECGGVIISNVSLHNAEFVEKYEFHIGNDIKLTRSGGVIPYVLEVKHDILMEMHNAHPEVKIPEVCPICGGKLKREGPILKCINEKCPAIIEGKMLRFCSKDSCDIKTIGESVIHDLCEKHLVTSIDDIIYLGARLCDDEARKIDKENFLKRLGKGYGEKTIDNIFDGIINARLHAPFEKIVAGLSIPNVGKVMARLLCKKFKDIFGFLNCTKEQLIEIEGVADTTAEDIFNWIHTGGEKTLEFIEEYGWNYSTWEDIEAEDDSDKTLNGLKVCFTGKSFKFKGNEVEDFLKKKGAEIGGVSKSLNYLIIGEKPGGSKVSKATELGIEIIAEKDFYEKYGLQSTTPT